MIKQLYILVMNALKLKMTKMSDPAPAGWNYVDLIRKNTFADPIYCVCHNVDFGKKPSFYEFIEVDFLGF